MKPALILGVLFFLTRLAPVEPVDPWKLVSPKKVLNLIFALAFIQAIGSILFALLGSCVGAILSGFLGGLVSSTATTASLARRSSLSSQLSTRTDMLTFLSATLAMLVEAFVITLYGEKEIHWGFLLLFSGPVVSTLLMMTYQSRSASTEKITLSDAKLELLPILKLAAFILAILALSKLLQKAFGQAGLAVLTFFVSLFEIHGSVIANLQLHDSGLISVQTLGGLLAVSIVASYVSKLFLILTLGSASLKKTIVKTTLVLFGSLAVSGALFFSFG